MTDHCNYTKCDLAAALAGVPAGLSPLDVDKYWAELKTSEEWARLPEEGSLAFMARMNVKAIGEEMALMCKPRSVGRRHEP